MVKTSEEGWTSNDFFEEVQLALMPRKRDILKPLPNKGSSLSIYSLGVKGTK